MNDQAQGIPQLREDICETKVCKPMRKEVLKEYEINLRFLSSGMVVSVGCKSVAFATIKEGMEAVIDYVANPYEEQKKWIEIFNKDEE